MVLCQVVCWVGGFTVAQTRPMIDQALPPFVFGGVSGNRLLNVVVNVLAHARQVSTQGFISSKHTVAESAVALQVSNQRTQQTQLQHGILLASALLPLQTKVQRHKQNAGQY